MKRFLPLLMVFVVVVAFAGTLVFLWQRSRSRPAVAHTEKPFVTDITRKTVVTGAIVPRREVAVKPRVSGVVEKLFVQPGDTIKAGAPIARIKIIPDMVNLNRAESAVESARIGLEAAERELTRNQGLHQREMISTSEFQRFKLDYELKKNELESAQANLSLVKDGASRKSGKVSNVVLATTDGRVLEVPRA